MFVGVARLVLQIPGARSLKDRRRVVKSFKERVRARLNVSIAELGDLERYQVATLGLGIVAGDKAHVSELLAQVVAQAAHLPDALLADSASEIFSFGFGGSELKPDIESVLDSGSGTGRGLADENLGDEPE